MPATSVHLRPSPALRLARALELPARAWQQRDRRLAAFGALMLLALLPALLALGLDDRVLRGVPVWIKPIKFMLSVAVFAYSSAWLIGHLSEARRRSRALGVLVWTLIGSAGFEVGYITLQAALGEASHYHTGDALHALLYTLMGVVALVLSGTQAVLARWLHRDGNGVLPTAYRRALVWAAALTFVLGAGAGMALGNLQPPAGSGWLPMGWHAQGDLRIAHFIGVHAQQALPLAGLLALAAGAPQATRAVDRAAGVWTLLWLAALLLALR